MTIIKQNSVSGRLWCKRPLAKFIMRACPRVEATALWDHYRSHFQTNLNTSCLNANFRLSTSREPQQIVCLYPRLACLLNTPQQAPVYVVSIWRARTNQCHNCRHRNNLTWRSWGKRQEAADKGINPEGSGVQNTRSVCAAEEMERRDNNFTAWTHEPLLSVHCYD